MNNISKIIIPIFILFVVFYGFRKNVDIYDSFLNGAKEGLQICFNIFPSIIAMVFAINIFLDSNFIFNIFIIFKNFNIPIAIITMALLRPISGTATLAIMNDIFIKHSPDSYLGRLASILQGCTDTTIYVIALYYGSIGIKKIRYSLGVGLFADIIGITAAFLLAWLLY